MAARAMVRHQAVSGTQTEIIRSKLLILNRLVLLFFINCLCLSLSFSQILLPILSPTEDLVVRIAAARALKVVIDDFEFSSDELEPFLGTAFHQLFTLLKEVDECDTKVLFAVFPHFSANFN